MILGIVIGLGTTKLLAFSFALTLIYVILKRPHVTVPKSIWVIVFCVSVTAVWSPEPGKPLFMSCAIILAYLAYRALPRTHVGYGLAAAIGIQIGVILWQYFVEDLSRPYGISRNASVVGMAGLYGLPFFPAAIIAGLSASRTAAAGSVLLAVLNFRSVRHWLVAAVVVIMSVTFGYQAQYSRYTSQGITRDLESRVAAIQGTSTEAIPSSDLENRVAAIQGTSTEAVSSSAISLPTSSDDVEFHWQGYGFGNYVFQTGRIQPHNIFVRTWYELGLFSIPVFYTLLWLWGAWSRESTGNLDWRFLIIVVSTGMLTDELLGSVEGVYMVLGYAILSRTSRQIQCPIMEVVRIDKTWRKQMLRLPRLVTRRQRNTGGAPKLT